MRKGMLLLMAGVAILMFANQAPAFSIAEDMGEGISLGVEQDNTQYKYDSLNVNTPESMTEYNFFPEKTVEQPHFKVKPEILTLAQAMNEGIWMEETLDILDTLPAPAAGK